MSEEDFRKKGMFISDVGYYTSVGLVYCGLIVNQQSERKYLYTTPEDYKEECSYLEGQEIVGQINAGAGLAGYRSWRLPVIDYQGNGTAQDYQVNNFSGITPPRDEVLLLYRNRKLIGGFQENGCYISGTKYEAPEAGPKTKTSLDMLKRIILLTDWLGAKKKQAYINDIFKYAIGNSTLKSRGPSEKDVWYRDFSDGKAHLESQDFKGRIRFVLEMDFFLA